MESAPVFVKIDKYKELATILGKIQDKLEATNKTIVALEQVKNEEETRIQEWKESLDLVQGKLQSVSEALHQK